MKKKVDIMVLVTSLSLIAKTGWWRLLTINEKLIARFCRKYGVSELENVLDILCNKGRAERFVSYVRYMTDATIPDTLRLVYKNHEVEWAW